MKPTPLKRTGPPERRTPLRRSRRLRRATELRRPEARLQILYAITAHHAAIPAGKTKAVCAVCGYDGFFLQVHHPIEREELRRYLSEKGNPCPAEVIWDPRNALVVCTDPAPNRCHERHTLAVKRIPRSALRPENFEFAEEHGLGYVLEAAYPEVRAA